jgi:hypothetical protein
MSSPVNGDFSKFVTANYGASEMFNFLQMTSNYLYHLLNPLKSSGNYMYQLL